MEKYSWPAEIVLGYPKYHWYYIECGEHGIWWHSDGSEEQDPENIIPAGAEVTVREWNRCGISQYPKGIDPIHNVGCLYHQKLELRAWIHENAGVPYSFEKHGEEPSAEAMDIWERKIIQAVDNSDRYPAFRLQASRSPDGKWLGIFEPECFWPDERWLIDEQTALAAWCGSSPSRDLRWWGCRRWLAVRCGNEEDRPVEPSYWRAALRQPQMRLDDFF